MLHYLDALATAALARESREIARLLAHPLARRLPRRVREEAVAIARRGPSGWMAPVHTLRCLQQLRQLAAAGEAAPPRPQLELPLLATG